jgi:archaellum component FlaF (FlaF/FlaG flagellin family)
VGVDRALWWSVSWPWLLLWFATLVAFVVLVVLVVRWLRRRAPQSEVPGLLFYVHGLRMINLCKVGRYDDAVTRQFVKQITVTKNGKLQVGPSEFGIGVDGSVIEQNTANYEKPATEIDVIGVVLAGLRAAHGVVDVDLTTQTIVADEAWRRRKARRLNDIRDYVSLHGRFQLDGGTDEKAVLLAPGGPARVRVECDRASLRDTLPPGQFNARCLGKVQSWNAETGEIVVLPVVVFQ